MTVGALSASFDARSSPIASGWPCQSTSSHSPPAPRMKEQTHSPARRTSPACAGSALIEGMRKSSASSSNHGSTRGRLAMRRSARLRDVAELLAVRQCAQLLQALVLDLADSLARDLERAADLVERARL